MSFQIDAIVLYGPEELPRILPLRPGELNIITGYSKTGKSSLISIVHYCLGSDECGVAYGPIRTTVEWYALRLVLDGQQIFVARQAPATGQESNSRMYYEVAAKIAIPPKSAIVATTNVDAVIQLLSRASGIVDNLHQPAPGQTKPPLVATLKHALSLCFQPQDEIISRRNLFFHQSEPFVKQAIQDTLPYFLGAVDDDHVIKLGRLRQLRQDHRQLMQRLTEARAVMGQGTNRGMGLLSEAADLGLVTATQSALGFDEMLATLQQITDRKLPTISIEDDLVTTVREYDRLLASRDELTVQLRRVETDLQAAQGLIADRSGYATEGAEQVGRLKSLELLPTLDGGRHSCPLCSSELPNIPTTDVLRQSLETLQGQLFSVSQDNPHLERLVAQLDEQRGNLRRQLADTRESLDALDRSRRQLGQYRDFIARAAHIRGRISIYLEATPKATTGVTDLERRTNALAEQIASLERELDATAVDERLDSIAAVVSRHLTDAGHALQLEHSTEGLRFLPKRLTIVADTTKGPIPMEKMGSGENWVGYHLAAIMSLHRVFVDADRPVPRFAFIDQPSQVSFPSDRDTTGRLEIAAEGRPIDKERATVLRMFEFLRDVVAAVDGKLQIILTEHADPEVEWYDKAVVERWRGKGLIPEEWIKRSEP